MSFKDAVGTMGLWREQDGILTVGRWRALRIERPIPGILYGAQAPLFVTMTVQELSGTVLSYAEVTQSVHSQWPAAYLISGCCARELRKKLSVGQLDELLPGHSKSDLPSEIKAEHPCCRRQPNSFTPRI